MGSSISCNVEESADASATAQRCLWRSEPDTRGTYSILSSCMITLSICAWSSLHLDIPTDPTNRRKNKPKTAMLRTFFVYLWWLSVGVMAPQILLVIALNQRLLAKKLMDDANRELSTSNTITLSLIAPALRHIRVFGSRQAPHSVDMEPNTVARASKRHKWGMSHGFYACMGGYVFDFGCTGSKAKDSGTLPFDTPSKFQLPSDLQRVVITRHGLRFLFKHFPHLIPNVSEESIADRNKADGLSKAIVMGQLIWFCVQLIGRQVQGLHISLLERSTAARGVTALLIYIMWWEKPYDISVPTVITGPDAMEACALMTLLTKPSAFNPLIRLDAFTSKEQHIPEAEKLQYLGPDGTRSSYMSLPEITTPPLYPPDVTSGTEKTSPTTPWEKVPQSPQSVHPQSPGLPTSSPPTATNSATTTPSTEVAESTLLLQVREGLAFQNFWISDAYMRHHGRGSERAKFTNPDVHTEKRWALASTALGRMPLLRDSNKKNLQTLTEEIHVDGNLLQRGSSLWQYIWYNDAKADWERWIILRQVMAILAFMSLYGVIHATALTSHRAWPEEDNEPAGPRTLWRIATACLLVPAIPLILLTLVVCVDAMSEVPVITGKQGGLDAEPGTAGKPSRDQYWWYNKSIDVCRALLFLSVLVYIPACVFLGFNSFRQLIHLPGSAFETPEWTLYWPHIS